MSAQLKISPTSSAESGGNSPQASIHTNSSPLPSPNNDYQGLIDKPPIPPRGVPPPPPVRQLSYENSNVMLRDKVVNSGNNYFTCFMIK